MDTIKNQFQSEHFYNPAWKIKHLFIGTFNPEGGEKVNYYYGRTGKDGTTGNKTWLLLSNVFNQKFDPRDTNFFKAIEDNGIACLDLIHQVHTPAENKSKVIGEGYNDNKIINTIVKREYNTLNILRVVKINPGIKIYSTWGKGSNLKEWVRETSKLNSVISLVSPSMAARVPKGTAKFDYMLNDWKAKIKV